MSTLNVQVETVRNGQPRRYADKVHELYIRFSSPDKASGTNPKEEFVKKLAKLFTGNFEELGHDERPFMNPYLKEFKCVGTAEQPGQWHIIVITPYAD